MEIVIPTLLFSGLISAGNETL